MIRVEAPEGATTRGIYPAYSHRRKVWPGQERLPTQLHSCEASRYLLCLDQQYLSGDEPADPAEDLFLRFVKIVLLWFYHRCI